MKESFPAIYKLVDVLRNDNDKSNQVNNINLLHTVINNWLAS